MLGINCRYDGSSALNKELIEFLNSKNLNPIPICPEQLGGLPTPRKRCEIAGDGFGVLSGKDKVYAEDGEDVTAYFIKGAEEALKIARIANVRIAILRSLSPSCGVDKIYDGTFTGKVKNGCGVTATILKMDGIEILSEKELERLQVKFE